MEELFKKMPHELATHLKSLIHTSGYDKDAASVNQFMQNWLKKKALFDKIVEHNGFHLVPRIDSGFKDGILVLTYSGSLLTLSGATEKGEREVIYNSIGLRKDTVEKVAEDNIHVILPLEVHKAVVMQKGKIKQTSPVLALAIEENPGQNGTSDENADEGEQTNEPAVTKDKKRFRRIGERISRALLLINQTLFSKNLVQSELENRFDLFEQWLILSWFRIGGWEEAVFKVRAHILWLELFSASFNELAGQIKDRTRLGKTFLMLSNQYFPHYLDEYKWLESEKRNFDIGLMKALEEVPSRDDYKQFLTQTIPLLTNG